MLSSTQHKQPVTRIDHRRPVVRLNLAPVPRLTQPLGRPAQPTGAADIPCEKRQDDELRYPLAGIRLL